MGEADQVTVVLDDELADAYASHGLLKSNYPRGATTSKLIAEAETDLTRAIELNPSYSDAYEDLSLLLAATPPTRAIRLHFLQTAAAMTL